MSKNTPKNNDSMIIGFRVPKVYKSILDSYLMTTGQKGGQWLIQCIVKSVDSSRSQKELLKSVADVKDALFFLKSYTMLDRDKVRAKKVFHSLDILEKQLTDILVSFS